MKKAAMAGALGFGLLIALLLSMFLIIASDEDSGGSGSGLYISVNLSAEVLAHQPMVEKYAQQNGISDYVYQAGLQVFLGTGRKDGQARL